MKKNLSLLCLFLSTFTLLAQPKVIGYLPTYTNFPNSINSVQLSKVTHINVAFANPNSSGTIILGSSKTTNQLATVVNTAHNQNVKVFLSIGGAGASAATYKTLLSNNTNMNNLVSNLTTYCTANNLDGIDVDIEGDVLDGTNVTKTQYENFVTALATSLHAQNKEMTAALASWFGSLVSNAAASKFDWINIMAYDKYGSWSGAGEHSPYSFMLSDFSYWNGTKGIPASKLVIGVPFYGYGWGTYANNGITFANIVNTYQGSENSDVIGSGNNMISYNGIPTIKQKTAYACANAAGIMIWELTQDATGSNSLLSAIHDQLAICTVGIKENSSNDEILSIYPNPTNDISIINISINSAAQTSIVIYDQLGKEISVINNNILSAGNHQFNINTSSFAQGIYYIKMLSLETTVSKTFVKQ